MLKRLSLPHQNLSAWYQTNKKVPPKKKVCVCVCVCEWEREVHRGGEKERTRERETVSVCARVYFLCVAAEPEPLLAMNPVVVTIFYIQSL